MTKTLIIDNGSYSVKIGYATDDLNWSPHIISNSIVRTKDKRLILGDLVDRNQNISGCFFKRPFERNQLTSWETEKLIWDYCFNSEDLKLHVNDYGNDPNDMNLILTEAPFTLPKITKNTDQIIFEEYGFKSYYKNITSSFVPFNWEQNEKLYQTNQLSGGDDKKVYKDYQLVIDSGFDSTYIIPVIYGMVYWEGVKRLDIGGRFLTGFLRELISFRYYDVTDETILVNNIKEQTCFVPINYNQSLEKLKQEKIRLGPRPKPGSINDNSMIVEYALPDYKTTTKGYLLTDELRKNINDVDELQIMRLYDERFSIPETLFDPAIATIKHRNGLIKTIYDSIYSCPELVRPLLVSNIVCIGGNFKFSGFKERLQLELKKVLPVEWDIRIGIDEDPIVYGWKSANCLATNHMEMYEKLCVNKSDYYEKGWGYVNEKLGCKLKGW
ncbi:Arp6 protein [Saccharomycopsis crataegensis]|uniref:Actin-like protein ARP6 n=1 Tax=Saccharomycopsis crataegensis TaxID=43959 RepID=A0AAV5QIK2_9ASCO|nr:Arp6 protein [Saccharomycopsis crataegensis]